MTDLVECTHYRAGAVTLTREQHGPPGLFAESIDHELADVDRPWRHFHTDHAHAWVLYAPGAPVYLVHDVHSSRRGGGSEVMRAVGEWADANRLEGSLVCADDLIEFYARTGWGDAASFGPGHSTLARFPTTSTTQVRNLAWLPALTDDERRRLVDEHGMWVDK